MGEINNVFEICFLISKDINTLKPKHILFLQALSENYKFPGLITPEDLVKLIEAGLLNEDCSLSSVSRQLLELYKSKKFVKKDTLSISCKEGGLFLKDIAKHLLYDVDLKKLSKYLKNEKLYSFFMIFMNMFPKETGNNKRWEKFFGGTNGAGVNLRRITTGTANKFSTILANHDVDVFLLGTFLFVKQSQNVDLFYVKSLENYFKEWDYWYDMALTSLENESKFINLNKNSITTNTVFI
jgi:hypothetical protein